MDLNVACWLYGETWIRLFKEFQFSPQVLADRQLSLHGTTLAGEFKENLNMTTRTVAAITTILAFIFLPINASTCAQQSVDHQRLKVAASSIQDTAKEPFIDKFSPTAAAKYLDGRAHLFEKDCFACHATFAYMPARSVLDPAAKEVIQSRLMLEKFVRGYIYQPPLAKKGNNVPRAQRILAAVELARHDAVMTGHLQQLTRKALDHMWEYQLDDGGIDWVRYSEPPSAVDDYWGIAIMAIGAGIAPDYYSSTRKAKTGIEKLRGWFAKHPPTNLHERGLVLLAHQAVGKVIEADECNKFLGAFFRQQLPDGGWSVAGLANWKRLDKQLLDPTQSDGYASAFATYVLRTSGVLVDDVRLGKAINWLKTHQRRSGGWYAPSQRKQDMLFSYTATSFAVQALAACGEIKTPKVSQAELSSSAVGIRSYLGY